MTIATAVRDRSGQPALPPLRQTPLTLATASDDAVSDETALIVDSIETMAELLGKDVEGVENSILAPEGVGAARP